MNAWAMARYEDAVGMYLGKDLPKTPEIELGKAKHELWGNYIHRTKNMHPELGNVELKAPVVEQKYEKVIPFNADYQFLLRGTPDLVDGEIIYEWKCGATEPTSYVESFQLDYYALLLPQAEVGIYKCHNPYTKETKTGVKFLNGGAERALEHIITFGGEFIDYLVANKILQDYYQKA